MVPPSQRGLAPNSSSRRRVRNAHANSFPHLFTLTAPDSALQFSVNASRPKSDEAQVFTGQNTSRHKRSNYNVVTCIDHACRIAYHRSHIGRCFRFGTRTKRNSACAHSNASARNHPWCGWGESNGGSNRIQHLTMRWRETPQNNAVARSLNVGPATDARSATAWSCTRKI